MIDLLQWIWQLHRVSRHANNKSGKQWKADAIIDEEMYDGTRIALLSVTHIIILLSRWVYFLTGSVRSKQI
jgi:hypothetical protein